MWRFILGIYLCFSFASVVYAKSEDNDCKATLKYRLMDDNDDCVVTEKEWWGGEESFRKRDWNSDGVLSGEEVRRGNKETNPYKMSFQELDRDQDNYISSSEWKGSQSKFRKLDRNDDGRLSSQEFSALREKHDKEKKDKRVDQFDVIDENNDDFISRDEWHGNRESFDKLDVNNDGRLTPKEFRRRDSALKGVRPGDPVAELIFDELFERMR